jgi:small-conductance mechanosensitive channel
MARTTQTELPSGARSDRRERSFATPVPVKVPALSSAIAVLLAFALTFALGGSVLYALIAAGATLVVAGIVARRTVASAFAGATLLLVRPYAEGERVRIQLPVSNCPAEVVIVHIGWVNTTLAADSGLLVVPNHVLLRNPPTPAAREIAPCP